MDDHQPPDSEPASPGQPIDTGAPAPQAAATPTTTAADAPVRAATNARSHTVRPGESLWTIAQRLVAPDASTTEIADEVDRLWDLNRDRIASGDPDVIFAGTELRLR